MTPENVQLIMKLIIRPASELGNRVFTSSDVVTGLIYLEINDSLSISEIQFCILARLRSTQTAAAGHEPTAIPLFCTLFESSQPLFPHPPLDKSARYTLGKGRHEYRFGVDLSLLSLYAQAELQNPYFRACQLWDSSRIFYAIRVTVKGCGLLRRRVRKSIHVVSATLDPPGIPRLPQSKGLSRQSCQILNLGALGLRSEPGAADDKVPPPYTPAIVLRAGISSDNGLLYVGDSLPLKLWVTVPFVAQRQLKAVLKSVRLFMVDPAVVSDRGRRVVHPAGTFIRQVQLDVPFKTGHKSETFEVDAASWEGCKVPESLPVIKSPHDVVQPYLLQILCEFVREGIASNVFTSVLVPVDIATAHAPPKYEVVNNSSENPTF